MLTNDVVSFEQPGPAVFIFSFEQPGPAVFFFASFLSLVQCLMEKNCFPRNKSFPIREDSILEGLFYPGKQTGCPKNCSLLLKWHKNIVYALHSLLCNG